MTERCVCPNPTWRLASGQIPKCGASSSLTILPVNYRCPSYPLYKHKFVDTVLPLEFHGRVSPILQEQKHLLKKFFRDINIILENIYNDLLYAWYLKFTCIISFKPLKKLTGTFIHLGGYNYRIQQYPHKFHYAHFYIRGSERLSYLP